MFKCLSSRQVYQNKWMTLREDIILRPDGSEGLFSVVEKLDFAVVIAIEGDRIHLVEQFRYPIQQRSLELPMGAWQDQPDADLREVALGELQEETGYKAEHIEKIGFQYVDNGGATLAAHVFFATKLSFVGNKLDAEEADLIALTLPIKEFEAKIINGEISDATTVAAYGLAKLKGLV